MAVWQEIKLIMTPEQDMAVQYIQPGFLHHHWGTE